MTRDEALATVRVLAAGLDPDLAGMRRLLERVSVHGEAEVLRDLLVEFGARAVLEDSRQ